MTDIENGLKCTSCSQVYAISNGVPLLQTPESEGILAEFRQDAENVLLRRALEASPWKLRLIEAIRPPHPFWFMRRKISRVQREAFSKLATLNSGQEDTVFIDIGSGILGGLNATGLSQWVRERIVPIEIAPTAGVGVVGDAHYLPFANESIDGVLIQGVLEHVLDPERIVNEIYGVLRPGAPVFAEVPFLQHYHLDPVDFRRWTHFGFAHLFKRFTEKSAGTCAGPATTLTDMLTEFPALLFKSPSMYWTVKTISGWIFSPVQLLDAVWAGRPRAHIMAGSVYFLGTKPLNESQ